MIYIDTTGFGEKVVYYRQLAKDNARGSLSAERRAQLDVRGMVWDASER